MNEIVQRSPDAIHRMKVFVSYARADLDFVDQLVLALEDKGFSALIDRHNIDAAERWQERLSALIASSDTVVFVLSPTSAASKICQWEVSEAVKLGKRLIPVVPVALKKAAPPAELAALNYIHFYKDDAVPGSGFYDGVRKLERALTVDLGWLRLQTRLNEDAAEWLPARADDRLLRGSSLDEAVTWLQRAPVGQSISQNLRDFIRTSEAAEDVRKAEAATRLAEREETLRKLSRRTAVGLVGASGLTILSGGLAWWGLDAESRFRAERERVAKAEEEARRKTVETEAARTDIEGQITVYAAAPGEYAQDGEPGRNSPFTTAMLEALGQRDMSLQQALAQASLEVNRKTNGKQRPYVATNLNGNIYLDRFPTSQLRRALCISVDQIKGSPTLLNNVGKDAEAWYSRMLKAGFEVRRLTNPTRAEIMTEFDWAWSTQPQKQGVLRRKASLLVPAKITVVPRIDGHLSNDPTQPGDRVSPEIIPEDLTPDFGPTEPLLQPVTRNPHLLVAIFYAGIGITSAGQDYLSTSDSEIKEVKGIQEISKVLAIAPITDELRLRTGISILLLDTNFNKIDVVEEAADR